VECRRNGKLESKHEGLVVVGDIIEIKIGSSLPADGIFLEGIGVECDESSMTGESLLCTKDTLANCLKKLSDMKSENPVMTESTLKELPSPLLLSGSYIKSGEGRFLAIAVGEQSCVGKVLAALKEKPTMTPLQKKLEGVADFIGKIGFYTAIATVGVLFIRYFISRIAYGLWAASDVGLCFGFVILGITVLIVAIPEGLPLAVTIALAYSVGKMFEENNFVKTLMVFLLIIIKVSPVK